MRLIDADALLKEYEGAFAYKLLKEVVGNMPTVEVSAKVYPVKIKVKRVKRLYKGNLEIKCKCCGEVAQESGKDIYISTPYCNNCNQRIEVAAQKYCGYCGQELDWN